MTELNGLTPSPFARLQRRRLWELREAAPGACSFGDARCNLAFRRQVPVHAESNHCIDCKIDALPSLAARLGSVAP